MNRHIYPLHNQAAIGAAGLVFIPHQNLGVAENVLLAVNSSSKRLFSRKTDCYKPIVVYAPSLHNTPYESFKELVGRIVEGVWHVAGSNANL